MGTPAPPPPDPPPEVLPVPTCRLLAEPAGAVQLARLGTNVFADDDLRLQAVRCPCTPLGTDRRPEPHHYLRVWRRVRGSYATYTVPVRPAELAELGSVVAAADDCSGKWRAAEGFVAALARQRSYIEVDDFTYVAGPARWVPPGTPRAFSFPPC